MCSSSARAIFLALGKLFRIRCFKRRQKQRHVSNFLLKAARRVGVKLAMNYFVVACCIHTVSGWFFPNIVVLLEGDDVQTGRFVLLELAEDAAKLAVSAEFST